VVENGDPVPQASGGNSDLIGGAVLLLALVAAAFVVGLCVGMGVA
jgi:hypothetical protein